MVTREHQPHLGRHVLHGRHGRPLALLWGEDEVAGTVEVEGGERPAGGVHSTHHEDWGHLVLGTSFKCSCLPPYLGLDQLVPSQLTHTVWRGEEEVGEVDQEAEWHHHHRTVLSSGDLRNSNQGVCLYLCWLESSSQSYNGLLNLIIMLDRRREVVHQLVHIDPCKYTTLSPHSDCWGCSIIPLILAPKFPLKAPSVILSLPKKWLITETAPMAFG